MKLPPQLSLNRTHITCSKCSKEFAINLVDSHWSRPEAMGAEPSKLVTMGMEL